MSSNAPAPDLDPNQNGDPTKKTYSKHTTGAAQITSEAHSGPSTLQLYGSCFCPFVHRIWIALELKGLEYQYIEVDVYRKPDLLLAINPRGLVPALRHGEWGCYESSVLMEYLEDLPSAPPLLPSSPQDRAYARLWTDHINRHIIPSFYKTLQAQTPSDQTRAAGDLQTHITTLTHAADATGPFFQGKEISFVDVQIAPWMVRLRKVLTPYRGWPAPERGTRWGEWVLAVEGCEAVRKTTSGDELYLESYERYAENRPNTSLVRDAVNEGGGLP